VDGAAHIVVDRESAAETMHRRHALAALAAIVGGGAAVIAAAVAGAASAAFQIRVGWAQTPGHLAPLVAELAKRHPEIMANRGRTYEFVPIRYAGSTPQIQALAIQELEVAAFSGSALTLAIANAHLDVKIVADVLQTGRPGYYALEYLSLIHI